MGKYIKTWITAFNSISELEYFTYELDIPLSELRIQPTGETQKFVKEMYGDKSILVPYIIIYVSVKTPRNKKKRGFLGKLERIEFGGIGYLDGHSFIEFSRFLMHRKSIRINPEPLIEKLKELVTISKDLVPEDPEFKFLCQK